MPKGQKEASVNGFVRTAPSIAVPHKHGASPLPPLPHTHARTHIRLFFCLPQNFIAFSSHRRAHAPPRSMDILSAHYPAGTSTLDIVHWAQLVRTGSFERFDFGAERNEQVVFGGRVMGGVDMPVLYDGSDGEEEGRWEVRLAMKDYRVPRKLAQWEVLSILYSRNRATEVSDTQIITTRK